MLVAGPLELCFSVVLAFEKILTHNIQLLGLATRSACLRYSRK